jgi:serine/threonine protein phosphatase 1
MTLYTFGSDWEPAPRPAPSTAHLFAIGDVHGHLQHLDALIGLLRPEIAAALARGRRVELVLVGDYVDRGPDSLGVLRRVAELPRRLGVPVHALRGNHDQYLVEFIFAERPDLAAVESWCGNGGDTTLAELGVTPADILDRDPVELAARARAAAGPAALALLGRLELRSMVGAYAFVHAGVHPKRAIEKQGPREFLWLREPFLGARDWQQPFVVVHGHTIRGPEVHPHRIAIDSGAYRTGVLTALEVEGERLRFWCVGSDPKLKAFRRLPGLEQARRFTSPRPLTVAA